MEETKCLFCDNYFTISESTLCKDFALHKSYNNCIVYWINYHMSEYSVVICLNRHKFNVEDKTVIVTNKKITRGYSDSFIIKTNSIEESFIKIRNIQLLG